ncbi:hypothetical protein RvY_05875 [Ramazzottius varieornatus]|uniref:Uncharacterized protein n=1 Tax=Ramazzottius varieornatus TaxID=947166 RepID=A0A1D1V360_RAMVA|nr:hypothetical protein RvY_05875 [Ramazzottius varieornatus]
MDSVNPMNVLKLLEEDYKQLFQLDGQPSEADKQLEELVKEFMDKLKALRLETGKQFFLAKQKPHTVRDMDIRRWAVTANRTISLVGFTASPDWVGKLKRYCSIVDRKITKFVTDKYIQKAPQVKKTAEECVALVRSRISDYGLDCM